MNLPELKKHLLSTKEGLLNCEDPDSVYFYKNIFHDIYKDFIQQDNSTLLFRYFDRFLKKLDQELEGK